MSTVTDVYSFYYDTHPKRSLLKKKNEKKKEGGFPSPEVIFPSRNLRV